MHLLVPAGPVGDAASQQSKEEADARSIYVGNVSFSTYHSLEGPPAFFHLTNTIFLNLQTRTASLAKMVVALCNSDSFSFVLS